MNLLGRRIRQARKELGLTQVELAKLVGIKQASISELETGETVAPSGQTLIAMAHHLNISATWLMTGKGNKSAEKQDQSTEILDLIERIGALSEQKRELLFQIFNIQENKCGERGEEGRAPRLHH